MTDFEFYSLIIATSGVIVAFFGLLGIYSGLQHNTHQQQAVIFIEYVKRFNDILDDVGRDVLLFCNKDTLTEEEKKKYIDFIGRYLSLLHQEYTLKSLSLIHSDIWSVWMSYVEIQTSSKHFKEAWKTLKESHRANPDFHKFINDLVESP